MTHEEFLKKLDVTHDEFKDLHEKFHHFFTSLNPKQQAVVKASMVPAAHAVQSLGEGATEHDVQNSASKTGVPVPVSVVFASPKPVKPQS